MNFTLCYATFVEEYEKLKSQTTIQEPVIVTLEINHMAAVIAESRYN